METLQEEDGIYQGQLKSSQKSGFGMLTWHDGSWYIGSWQDNDINGWGILSLRQGGEFAGCFKNNKLNGYGKCDFPNGDRYIGMWKNGNTHGYGVFYFAHSKTWELGVWDNGRKVKGIKSGTGKPSQLELNKTNKDSDNVLFEMAEGSKYAGGVLQGMREGNGVLYLRNGGRVEGTWSKNYPTGVCIFHFADGKYHIGEYRYGILHGLGRVNFSNGDYYFGEFLNGKMEGKGKFFSAQENTLFEGEFKENELIASKPVYN